MNLPDPLKKALAEQPKYNPSVPAVNLNRMKRGDRKMLDDTACDTERSERVSDRHSAEARMLDEILGDHNVPKKISGNRRRSREPQPSYGSNGSNGSDDESVTSVSSRSERVKPLQARDIGAPQSVGQPGVSPRVRLSQKKSAPCSNKSASAGGDLLSAMTVRLTTLEMKYSVAVKESLKKDSVIEKLKKRNATLKKAGEDSDKNNGSVVGELEQVCEGLREEVAQMKMFLKDYGLVWVGAGEASEGVEEKVESKQREQTKSANPCENDRMIEPMNFDRDIFVQRVGELNSMIQADKAKIVKNGQNAKLQYAKGVGVVLFEDGLGVEGYGKVMKFGEERCERFVADIVDGFFPGMFKEKFPDGVKIVLTDRRDSQSGENLKVFAGEGNKMVEKCNVKGLASIGALNFSPMSAEEFLEKLPEKSVGADGSVYDLRNDIKEKLKAPEAVDACVGESPEDVLRRKREAAVEAAEKRMKAKAEEAEVEVEVQAVAAPVAAPIFKPKTPVKRLNSSMRRKHSLSKKVEVETEGEGDVEVAAAVQDTTLRIRMDSKTVTMKLSYKATVRDLKAQVKEEFGVEGEFEVRTSHPNKAYTDLSETMLDAGLCPNGTVNIRLVK